MPTWDYTKTNLLNSALRRVLTVAVKTLILSKSTLGRATSPLRVARTRVLLRKIRVFTATVSTLRVLSLTGLVLCNPPRPFVPN